MEHPPKQSQSLATSDIELGHNLDVSPLERRLPVVSKRLRSEMAKAGIVRALRPAPEKALASKNRKSPVEGGADRMAEIAAQRNMARVRDSSKRMLSGSFTRDSTSSGSSESA